MKKSSKEGDLEDEEILKLLLQNKVLKELLKDKISQFYAPYFYNRKKKLPYIKKVLNSNSHTQTKRVTRSLRSFSEYHHLPPRSAAMDLDKKPCKPGNVLSLLRK